MAFKTGFAGGFTDVDAGTVHFPGVSFEVAFTSDPNAEDPTWEDLTEDLRYQQMVETSRGRQRELDQYQAGTMSATLNNRTRDYDDQNSSSPWYPNVKPMKRVRVRASYGGTIYPVFAGYVDEWALGYENPSEATATVRATDAFKPLAAAQLATSAYAQEVAADEPAAWWRLDESDQDADPLTVHDVVGDFDLPAYGTPLVGSESLIARDPGASITFDDDITFEEGFARNFNRVPVLGGPLTIEAVVRLHADDSGEGILAAQITKFAGVGFALGQNPPVFGVNVVDGVLNVVSSTVTLDPDETYHVAGVWEAAGDLKIYVDGVDVTGTPDSVPVTTFPEPGVLIIGSNGLDAGLLGQIDEVAFYDHALSAARVAAHAAAVTTPWNNDTPAARIDRVLDAVTFPENLRSNSTHSTAANGSSTLQSATLNMSALEHLRRVAASEFGDLLITRAGEVRLIGRVALTNQDELFTFTDDDPTTLPSYKEIGWDSSDQLIRNDVIVSRNEGIAQRVTNEASIDTYLRHTYTADGLIHDSDTLSRHAAEFIVAEYSEHKRRITRMVVAPTRNPTVLFPAVLGVELGDEVTVTFHPPGGGTFTQDSRIEGISHRFNDKQWETTFALSPAYADDFLELDAGPDNAGLDAARLFF